MSRGFYLGIDVGTTSARAGLFDDAGRMVGHGSDPIQIWRPAEQLAEQSSEDIWRACGRAARAALAAAGLVGDQVKGVGFDATCSLVALDAGDRPVTVSPTGEDAHNVILWMDHRATAIAERINAAGHPVLRYVGGRISPEMETPKLIWLKENLPATWRRAARFFDLADFLVYRATGADVRSLCTTVCKWTYLGHEDRWDETYFRQVGLGELVDEEFARIGRTVRPLGEAVGDGLTARAADELCLRAGTPVAVSIIDAHAGGIGLLGTAVDGRAPAEGELEQRVALIGGTSSCHMAVSRQERVVPGVWGPYYAAMVPGMWLTEGGQSATGALIDHVIHSHARAVELAAEGKRRGMTVYALLNERLDQLAGRAMLPFPAALAHEVHVLPDFHGNRSPRADPGARGMVSGLKLADTVDALAVVYLATIQAIAHGTRHIVQEMNAAGYCIQTIVACGGDNKNPVFVREHADVTGCRVVLPAEPESVLLGSAILGAVAAKRFPSVLAGMSTMSAAGQIIEPAGGTVADFHRAKHRVFHRMVGDQLAYRGLMGEPPEGA